MVRRRGGLGNYKLFYGLAFKSGAKYQKWVRVCGLKAWLLPSLPWCLSHETSQVYLFWQLDRITKENTGLCVLSKYQFENNHLSIHVFEDISIQFFRVVILKMLCGNLSTLIYLYCVSALLIGDNILAVLKYLATSEKLAKSFEYRHGNVVFFDILGLFVLAYPARVGTIINYITAAIAFFYLSKKVLQPKPRGKCTWVLILDFFFFFWLHDSLTNSNY